MLLLSYIYRIQQTSHLHVFMFAANQDYCEISKNNYTIPAGSTSSQEISIIIINDRITEGNEILIVIMELVDNPDLQAKLSTGSINIMVVTIQDNDSTCLNIM